MVIMRNILRLVSLIIVLAIVLTGTILLTTKKTNMPNGQFAVTYTDAGVYYSLSSSWRLRLSALSPNKKNRVLFFDAQPHTYSFDLTYALPQATDLIALLNVPSDEFTYSIQGQITYRIKPAQFAQLLTQKAVPNQDIQMFYQQTDLALQQAIYTILGERQFASMSIDQFIVFIQKTLKEQWTILTFEDIKLNVTHQANFALYEKSYQQYKNKLPEVLPTPTVSQSPTPVPPLLSPPMISTEEEKRLQLLERYGELLTKYPILLEYLALEKGIHPSIQSDNTKPAQGE
jgi:hypothetical protein